MAERRRRTSRSNKSTGNPPGEALASGELGNEIKMLRSAIRQFYQAAGQAEDLDSRARALKALSGSMAGLARMIKMQNELGRGDSFEDSLIQALEEVQLELGL